MSLWSVLSNVLSLHRQQHEDDKEEFFLYTKPEHVKALAERKTDASPGRIPDPLNLDWVKSMIESFVLKKGLSASDTKALLLRIIELLDKLPNVVEVDVHSQGLVICGDIHGQFYDFLTIFRKNGFPSDELGYVFNGDFVDRGSMGVEVFLTLSAFKLLFPSAFHMVRGNHECTDLTLVYGFAREVSEKYDDYDVYRLFVEAFRRLPVCLLVQQSIMVMHGGLSSNSEISLKYINSIERREDPVEEPVLQELLWSDPQDKKGIAESARGAGVLFGPDVTKQFLSKNKLGMIVRSHELKFKGFSQDHHGKCVTIFSAPNYRGFMGNKGAWMKLNPNGEHRIVQFSAVSKRLTQHFK